MKFTKFFKDLNRNNADIAGGKGASLGEMTGAGIPVPPGFVILAGAFERFCEETDLDVEIDAILHTVNHKEIHTVDGASEKIKELILNAEMPNDIKSEIEVGYKKLNAKYVAVRSSATAEDGAEHAWAGQLDSFLNTPESEVLNKVKHCWASLFTPRAIFYRFEKDLHNTKISVAVVIQKMVESEVSGIAFSVHPVTEDYNQLIIEAGLGLGEAIVSGQITPDSYVAEKEPRRIIDKNISEQERGLYKVSSGPALRSLGEAGNEWKDLGEKGKEQKLSDSQILKLSELILHIEKHYGFPCDIEWAYEGGEFYIVQSRPITTLSKKVKTEEEKAVWISNFQADNSGWHLCGAFIDFGMWEFQKIIFGKDSSLILDDCFIYCKGMKVEGFYQEKKLVKLIEKLMKLVYEEPEMFFKNHKESYILNDKCMVYDKKCLKMNLGVLDNKKLSKVFVDWNMFYEKSHQHSLGSTWFIDSYGGVFANSLLEKTKAIILVNDSKLNPAEVFTALTTSEKTSFGQKEEIESLKVLEKIMSDDKAKKVFKNLRDYSKLPEDVSLGIKKSIISHRNKWCWIPFGYVGPAYDLDYYLAVWSGLVRENTDVKKEIKKLLNRSIEIKRNKKILIKTLNIPKNLQEVYEIAADITFLKGYRKDATYYSFYVLEKILKEISKRIGLNVTESHMVTYKEIEDLLVHDKKMDKEEIARRKDCAIMTIKDGNLVVYSGDEAKKFFADKNIKKEEIEINSDVFKGTCASSGKAKGVVKTINTTAEMDKMNQGDIMVAHTTFPALVPAMKKASAIVTEDGGITCHAAIVARELKTPCVTGIKTITKIVKDGDEVEVDADNGVVKIIKKHS
jgi:phosphohistidine swiveling domain-containing protein